MANNRLWAVCVDDNEAVCLAKNYGSWDGHFQENPAFFDKHADCPSNHCCGENIIFCTEVNDKRIAFYDFRTSPVKIYLAGQSLPENLNN